MVVGVDAGVVYRRDDDGDVMPWRTADLTGGGHGELVDLTFTPYWPGGGETPLTWTARRLDDAALWTASGNPSGSWLQPAGDQTGDAAADILLDDNTVTNGTVTSRVVARTGAIGAVRWPLPE